MQRGRCPSAVLANGDAGLATKLPIGGGTGEYRGGGLPSRPGVIGTGAGPRTGTGDPSLVRCGTDPPRMEPGSRVPEGSSSHCCRSGAAELLSGKSRSRTAGKSHTQWPCSDQVGLGRGPLPALSVVPPALRGPGGL